MQVTYQSCRKNKPKNKTGMSYNKKFGCFYKL